MEFETLRQPSILSGSDAVEHSSIAKNGTTDMQQSFPYQHKNLLEDAMDTIFKGEVHSRMAIYFLYANKRFIQKYVIHQNFSFQRALNPYEIFL